jgi:hypothetical protein
MMESRNTAANRVAHALLELRGEGPEPVALLIANGAPFVVASLGAAKAGKILVPMDPSFPPARLTAMREQSQASVIVTDSRSLALAHELAARLDDRRRELGERALGNPEPWLTRYLGPPPGPDASPVLREDYARRAGTAAAYREARGITDPDQAVSFGPHPGPELEALREDTFRVLEIANEQAEIRAMSQGELEAQVLEAGRAQATAPPDTSSQLRLTSQAEADAWQQSADAEAEHDQVQAENARSLATTLAAQTSRLETANARYEEWSVRTASTREIAGKAKAELQRRGLRPSEKGG